MNDKEWLEFCESQLTKLRKFIAEIQPQNGLSLRDWNDNIREAKNSINWYESQIAIYGAKS